MKNITKWRCSYPEHVAIPSFRDKSKGVNTRLEMELKSPDSAGFWCADYAIEAGAGYRIEATMDVSGPFESYNYAGVIVTWKKTMSNDTQLQREYLDPETTKGKTVSFSSIFTAPENAEFAEIRLYAKWMKLKVEWKDIDIRKVPVPEPRPVKVVTTKVIPKFSPSAIGENVLQVGKLLKSISDEVKNPDIILFPENMLDRCVKGPLTKRAETIPGPFTRFLSGWAKRLKCHIATTIHEKDRGRFYNTAFIVDRKGRIAGKYRKAHLTLSELEAGILPGNDFMVFKLDFGKVGFATCWDNWFMESSRMLRLKGAEMILFPLAGDVHEHLEHIWPARAIDNGLPLVVSVWQGEPKRPVPSRIYDGAGNKLAETTENLGYTAATIDLNKKHRTFWLSVGPSMGEGRSLFIRERRPDLYKCLTRM